MVNKTKNLLVMAATGNYIFSVANVLIGLKKYSKDMFDHIVVYTDKTTLESDKEAINKIFDVEFKEYNFQISSEEDRKRLSYYSNMPYARYEMLNYLDEYQKVVWFDSDFLITDDISELLNYGDKTGFSMAKDLEPYPDGHSINAFFTKPVPEYDMNAKAFASGLVIFSDRLHNPLELKKYLYEKTNQYSSYLRYAEQGILHLMAQDYNIEIEEFPKLIFHAFPFENKTKAKIIHLLGNEKPWKCYMYGAYEEWYENHKNWIELGGSEPELLKKLIEDPCYQTVFFGEQRYQNILEKYLYNQHKISFEKNINGFNDKIHNLTNDFINPMQREILDIKNKPSFLQKIFSVKNSDDRKNKIIRFFGFKIRLRRRYETSN